MSRQCGPALHRAGVIGRVKRSYKNRTSRIIKSSIPTRVGRTIVCPGRESCKQSPTFHTTHLMVPVFFVTYKVVSIRMELFWRILQWCLCRDATVLPILGLRVLTRFLLTTDATNSVEAVGKRSATLLGIILQPKGPRWNTYRPEDLARRCRWEWGPSTSNTRKTRLAFTNVRSRQDQKQARLKNLVEIFV